MNELARGALELRALVERFTALSQNALESCEVPGGADALAAALEARELVTQHAAALARDMTVKRRAVPLARRASVDALFVPVERAVQQAQAVNVELLERANRVRTDLGRDIARLRVDQEATTAYASATARATSRGVDVKR